MTWQTLAAVAFTVLSIAAQVVALSEVRSWGQEKRQGIARRLRRAWWSLTRRQPATQRLSVAGAVHAHTATSPYLMSSALATELASYMESVETRIADLSEETREHTARLAGLEAHAERAEALAAEQTADARLAGAWVIAGAVLAILALLPQAFA